MVVYIQRNSTHLFIAAEVFDSFNANHWLEFFFDEGDDGLYGSGSFDYYWKPGQDDYKEISGGGVLRDGNFDDFNMPNSSSSQVDFQGVVNYYTDHYEFELAFPLEGADGKAVDRSDLNVTVNDIIGFNIVFFNLATETLFSGQYVEDFTYLNLTNMETGIDIFEVGIIPDGSEPVINGTIEANEWQGAARFQNLDSERRAELYFLRNSSHLMIAISAMDYVYHVGDEITFFFDEGNDGAFGSGSHDGIMTSDQEDYKYLDADGYQYDGYYTGSGFTGYAADLDFTGYMEYRTDHWEMEFSFPLRGIDGRNQDRSDLNVSVFDEIGVHIELMNYSGLTSYFPLHSNDAWYPRSYFKLKLGHIDASQARQTKCQNAQGGKVWLNGTAYTDQGILYDVYVYPPSIDTTNATGVTWSLNQGTKGHTKILHFPIQ